MSLVSTDFNVNIRTSAYALTSQVAISKHPFFENDQLSINIFIDKIEFGIITIDSNGKSYNTTEAGGGRVNSNGEQHRKVCTTLLGDYVGKYLIDLNEVTEDKLTIWLEDKIEN